MKEELEEVAEPIGNFILAQNDIQPTTTPNGAFYHYSDVCQMLKRLDAIKQNSLLTFYAVKSQDGKFFRAKGYGGYGNNWVDDITKARIYAKPGAAKSRVTWFFKHYPEYGKADVIELHVTNLNIFDETKKRKNKSKEIKNSNDFFVFKT